MIVENNRLFIAIDIADSLCNDLKCQVYKKGHFGNASWVSPENYHITLKFLGDVPASETDKVANIISKAAAGKGEVTLTYTKMGVFPNLSRPKVVWVGFQDSGNTLISIVNELEDGIFTEFKIPKEKRPFTPHLTIARIKDTVNTTKLSEFIKKSVNFSENSFKISEIILYKSELKPTVAVYTKVKGIPL